MKKPPGKREESHTARDSRIFARKERNVIDCVRKTIHTNLDRRSSFETLTPAALGLLSLALCCSPPAASLDLTTTRRCRRGGGDGRWHDQQRNFLILNFFPRRSVSRPAAKIRIFLENFSSPSPSSSLATPVILALVRCCLPRPCASSPLFLALPRYSPYTRKMAALTYIRSWPMPANSRTLTRTTDRSPRKWQSAGSLARSRRLWDSRSAVEEVTRTAEHRSRISRGEMFANDRPVVYDARPRTLCALTRVTLVSLRLCSTDVYVVAGSTARWRGPNDPSVSQLFWRALRARHFARVSSTAKKSCRLVEFWERNVL